MSRFQIELDTDGIPHWLKMVTESLCDTIQTRRSYHTNESFSELKANTYVFVPKTGISSSNLFNDWVINHLKSEGYKVLEAENPMTDTESYDKAYTYLHNNSKSLFVDLSNQLVTKYVCDTSNTVYKSVRPIKFEDVTMYLCGSDGRPPLRQSFSYNDIDSILSRAIHIATTTNANM